MIRAILALALLLGTTAAYAQSSGTVNLAGPKTTPGAVPLLAPAVNSAINAALATKQDFGGAVNAGTITAGTLPAARLPVPTSSTLGGVQSVAGASHQWLSGISAAGVPVLSQPAFGDLSGVATTDQLPIGTSGATVPLFNGANTWSGAQTFNSAVSGSGAFSVPVSLSTVTATGSPTALTLADLAAQQGVLLDAFHVAGDADDTASMTRAVAAGVPILLGPKTYTINNFSSGAVTNFVLIGVPGRSIIQRTSASGSVFFRITAANVVIDGVTFDSNRASVTANQWGVFLDAGGQTVNVRRSVFKNNSGTIGSCFSLLSTGPAAGGSFWFTDNEVTNCTLNSAYFGSVTNGTIARNYVHDNTTFGIFVGSNGTASATNYSTEIAVNDNRVYRSVQGIAVGGFGPPYAFGTPAATHVRVINNALQDNSGYQLVLQGDYLTAIGNHIDQSSTPVSDTGGIDSNSRYNIIDGNIITLAGSSYGIDCGGSIQTIVKNNIITMTSGQAIDSGGNQNSVFSDNKMILSGTAIGVYNYQVESSGTNAFPTIASGTLIERNTFDMSASTTRGIVLMDNSGGRTGTTATIVRDNRFNVTGGGTSPSQDITWFGAPASLIVGGNYHNGTNIAFIDPNGSGDVSFDYVYGGGTIQGSGSTTNVRSIITPNVNSYGSGQSILYVEVSAGGSGYVPATTTLAANGTTGGSGWAGTAMINNGVILGVRTTAQGSGYTGVLTVTATDTSGGTGATFTVGNTAGLPRDIQLSYQSSATHVLQASGGFIGFSGTSPLIATNTTKVGLQGNTTGAAWNVTGFTIPALTTANLPTCNATALNSSATATDALAPTYGGTLTGGGAVRVSVRCNGTNWLTY